MEQGHGLVGWFELGSHPHVQVIQLYDSGGLSGYDHEGCPVWFDIIGTLDPKGLLLSASKEELIRKRIKVCELLLRECELQSQKVSDWVQDGKHMVGPICLKSGHQDQARRAPHLCFSLGLSTLGFGGTWLLPQSPIHEHLTCAWHPLLTGAKDHQSPFPSGLG